MNKGDGINTEHVNVCKCMNPMKCELMLRKLVYVDDDIESSRLINDYLLTELNASGISIDKKTIYTNINDVERLNKRLIFNCRKILDGLNINKELKEQGFHNLDTFVDECSNNSTLINEISTFVASPSDERVKYLIGAFSNKPKNIKFAKILNLLVDQDYINKINFELKEFVSLIGKYYYYDPIYNGVKPYVNVGKIKGMK
jgi:hypothetical protein